MSSELRIHEYLNVFGRRCACAHTGWPVIWFFRRRRYVQRIYGDSLVAHAIILLTKSQLATIGSVGNSLAQLRPDFILNYLILIVPCRTVVTTSKRHRIPADMLLIRIEVIDVFVASDRVSSVPLHWNMSGYEKKKKTYARRRSNEFDFYVNVPTSWIASICACVRTTHFHFRVSPNCSFLHVE